MIDREMFDRIKQQHGRYASWAVWAEPTGRAKSNIGDLSVLDPDINPALLGSLRNDVVMLGLNVSRYVPPPLSNFHDQSSSGQDFKIRYAFSGTSYYGAYMTDLIKDTVRLKSGDMMRDLAASPRLVAENVKHLLEEFADLHAYAPLVIAFGKDVYGLALAHLPRGSYSRLVRVVHYSHQISKEAYRESVLADLEPARS